MAYKFDANAESELYLSLINPAWRSTVINKALSRHMSGEALIDIADGKGVVNFMAKLDQDKKAEVLRRFCTEECVGSERAEPKIWDVVVAGEPKDSFVMAAKYLTLYQLKYGKAWEAAKEITGDKTRRRRRKALKMAQWELGERAGMHRTYISDLENDSRNLSLSNLYELAEALGTDGSKLLASVERQLKKKG